MDVWDASGHLSCHVNSPSITRQKNEATINKTKQAVLRDRGKDTD